MNGTSTQGWVPYNGAEAKASLSAVLPEIPGASKISMGATVQMGSRVTISLKNYYDTATNTLKPARVETGAEIRVPLFIEEGETVEVDSRDGSYLGRVKV